MKSGIKILAILLTISAIVFYFDQRRIYHCLPKGECITVWKRMGGKCYIMIGEYKGFRLPEAYIETTNDNGVTLIFDSSAENRLIVSNNYRKPVVFHSLDGYKYYDFEDRDAFVAKYYLDGRVRKGLQFFSIDIKENMVDSGIN